VKASIALALIAALASVGCTAETLGGRVCAAGCEAGTTCVAGRCRAADAPPSPVNSRRILLEPTDLAVIASSTASGAELPDAVALGRAEDGTVELLLRFSAAFREGTEVMSAFVLLEPAPGAQAQATPTSVEMARILEPWQPTTVSWGRQPRLAIPALASVTPAPPDRPLRVDVTQLVREWKKRMPDDHGIALLVRGNSPVGTPYSTGMSFGHGPRLEVYLR